MPNEPELGGHVPNTPMSLDSRYEELRARWLRVYGELLPTALDRLPQAFIAPALRFALGGKSVRSLLLLAARTGRAATEAVSTARFRIMLTLAACVLCQSELATKDPG